MDCKEMMAHIDAKAGAVRACYITVSPGQEATYIMKAAQSKAFSLAGFVGEVPGLIRAEMDATGDSAPVAVAKVLGEEAAWAQLAGVIEGVRRSAKQVLGSATATDEQKHAAYLGAIDVLAGLMR